MARDRALKLPFDQIADPIDGWRPIDEAVVDSLRQIHDRYLTKNRFKPGDLVTPTRGGTVKGAGEPHIVLEVFDPPVRGVGSEGSPREVSRIDMRVLCWIRGTYAPFAAESWQYEPWKEQR